MGLIIYIRLSYHLQKISSPHYITATEGNYQCAVDLPSPHDHIVGAQLYDLDDLGNLPIDLDYIIGAISYSQGGMCCVAIYF